MDTTTIIVGNGLGMAIDKEYFTLDAGLKSAWEKLDADTQNRIKTLITNGSELTTEEQLEKHYDVIQACMTLYYVENRYPDLKWLHEDAKKFSSCFYDFIRSAALYFFNYEDSENRLGPFITSMKNFIKKNHSHLATLNYDKLLYSPLVTDLEIMDGYNGKLVDGLVDNGYGPDNLMPKFQHIFGWYLHLHGSPLFYTAVTGLIKKDSLENNLPVQTQKLYSHIILCNPRLKPMQIYQSELLNSYWQYFREALSQSNQIILLGYSGKDAHVNKAIEKALTHSKEIKIIEYDNKNDTDRENFWVAALGLKDSKFPEKNFHLNRMSSILDYRFDQ